MSSPETEARSTPRRKKQAQRPQFGLHSEEDHFTVAKLWEKITNVGNWCPTPESCLETAYVVKDRTEGRFCMDAIRRDFIPQGAPPRQHQEAFKPLGPDLKEMFTLLRQYSGSIEAPGVSSFMKRADRS